MKRTITEDEEQAYRLCHHDFAGFNIAEAAKIMKVAPETVRLLLKSLRAKVPQLFPILTHRQHLVYWLYVIKGLSQQKIAIYLNTTQSNIWNLLNRAKKKGMPILKPTALFRYTITYKDWMGKYIAYKF